MLPYHYSITVFLLPYIEMSDVMPSRKIEFQPQEFQSVWSLFPLAMNSVTKMEPEKA